MSYHEGLMAMTCHEGCRFCLKGNNGISGDVKAHFKRFVVLAGGGMAHKRGIYDTLDGLSWYFRGFKKVTQLPWEG